MLVGTVHFKEEKALLRDTMEVSIQNADGFVQDVTVWFVWMRKQHQHQQRKTTNERIKIIRRCTKKNLGT